MPRLFPRERYVLSFFCLLIIGYLSTAPLAPILHCALRLARRPDRGRIGGGGCRYVGVRQQRPAGSDVREDRMGGGGAIGSEDKWQGIIPRCRGTARKRQRGKERGLDGGKGIYMYGVVERAGLRVLVQRRNLCLTLSYLTRGRNPIYVPMYVTCSIL